MTVGWTQVQDTGNTAGTAGITFTPAATQAGTLLVAKVVAQGTTTPSTPPNSNWWLGGRKAVAGAGMVETWYMHPRYNAGGITSVAFGGVAAISYRGSLAEVKPPAGTDVVAHAIGRGGAAAVAGSYPTPAACGNAPGSLGVETVGTFYGAAVPATQTWAGTPAGWVLSSRLSSGPSLAWASYYALNLAQGTVSITPTFTYTTGMTGWASVLVIFRARTFQHLRLDGMEVSTMHALDPTGQVLLQGGDVMGAHRTCSPKLGDQWEAADNGLWQDHWTQFATVAWSPFTTASGPDPASGVAYAGVGKSNDGGFAASTDGGLTWPMRSTAVQFVGNNARTPLPTEFKQRSTGNLLAFDVGRGLIYAATYDGGVARSADRGQTWTYIGLVSQTVGGVTSPFYCRGIVANPATDELLVACYDWDGTGAWGKVWRLTSASTAAATTGVGGFVQETASPATPEELVITGGYVYCAAGPLGIFRHQVGGAGWTNLNGGPIDAVSTTGGGSIWTGIDGYVDGGGNHQIIAVCGNPAAKQGANAHFTHVVQIQVTGAGAVSYTAGPLANGDLTGGSTIAVNTIPPDGRTAWKQNFYGALGNSGFQNPHVLIDPNDTAHQTFYVAGYGGCFRTYDGGATWDMPVNGMNMSRFNHAALSPTDPNHIACAGSDTEHSDLTDLTGTDVTKWHNYPFPQVKAESHGAAWDPDGQRVYGITNTKYGANDGGLVYYRAASPAGSGSSVWTDMGFGGLSGPAGSPACIGLYAGRDDRAAPNNRFACVVAQGAGMWRWTGGTSWSQADAGIGTKWQVAQVVPIIQGSDPSILFCWDRGQGVYRSADYGRTWLKIWAKTCTDPRTGWIAANPNRAGEIWVSHDGGLTKLSGANTGFVGGSITTTAIPAFATGGAGGIAFGPAGQLYAVQLASASQTGNMLLVCTDTAITGSSTWQDVCGGDGSFSSYASKPQQLLVTPNGLIFCITDTNQAVYAQPGPVTPVVTITTTSLPAGTQSVAYPSTTLQAIGGSTPYTWAVTTGSLPAGLSLSSAGVITGTPTAVGTSTFTVTVTDNIGATGTQVLTIVVAAAVTVTTTSPLPGGTAGQSYSQALAASGGNGPPWTWTVTAGALPPGLALSSAGTLSGVPSAAGTYVFTATAKDPAGRTGSASLSLTIAAPPLEITTGALANGTVGTGYSGQFTAAGGTPGAGYTWAVTSGSLPPGLVLTAFGALIGTPTAAGSFTFTVRVTDSLSATASASFTLVVLPRQAVVHPKGPWKILFGPCQPGGGYSGIISQARSRQITLRCEPGQYHEVTADISGRDKAAKGITELQTDLTVMYGGRLITKCRVWPTQNNLDASGHRRQVSARGYTEVLRRRAILPGVPAGTLSATSQEQSDYVWNLVKYTQGLAAGDLGIARGAGAVTGVPRTHTFTLGDYIADAIDILALLTSGFEWQVEPTGPADLVLNLYSPNMGTDKGVVLAYGGKRVSSIAPRSVDPSGYANTVYVTGNGPTAVYAEASDLPTRPEGRWDHVEGTQIKTQTSLNDFASQLLARLQVVVPTYTIILYPGAWGGPDDIWLGDLVTVRIKDGHLLVNEKLRVVEMAFDLGPDNKERLTLTAGMIPFRPHQRVRLMLQLLRYLSTR